MRFATWNLCGRDTSAKLARLQPTPDVAVLCEVRRDLLPPLTASDTPEWFWEGRLADRGLAVASWGTKMKRIDPTDGLEPGTHCLAASLEAGPSVVGIWACPEKGRGSYAQDVLRSLQAYESLITSQACIIAGDFNVSPGGPHDRRTGLTSWLADRGYVSVYHAFHRVEFGAELHHTYWHQYERDRPFHIDLVFVPQAMLPSVRSVTIAPYDGWVGSADAALRSDHAPVTVEFELGVGAGMG